MEQGLIGEPTVRADPVCLSRRVHAGQQRVARLDRPELHGSAPLERLADALRHLRHGGEPLPDQLLPGAERFGCRNLGHQGLVLEPRLGRLEGADHAQERLSTLDGLDPARGEALPVPDPVHLVDDGVAHVAGPQEVGVERMRQALLDGAAPRDQRLADDLPAEDRLPADVARLAPEEVHLQRLQVKQPEQIVERGPHLGHGHLPAIPTP
jgi:hypothetical protein